MGHQNCKVLKIRSINGKESLLTIDRSESQVFCKATKNATINTLNKATTINILLLLFVALTLVVLLVSELAGAALEEMNKSIGG